MLLSLVLSAVTVSGAATLAARADAGDTACTTITSSLGDAQVAISPLNASYIESRHDYWNARQSKYHPSCVVYPKSSQDVSVAIRAIRASGSRFAIKAGGHSPNNFFSSVDRGVLIDFKSMTAKAYDSSTTLATYEPGSNWGQLYSFYQQYGRTVMGGRLSGVGTGLALGGYLAPQYGMACDSFKELEVVLPNGTITTASATSNSDLFFGLRGGGGNAFGIVTRYTVQSQPIGKFYAGTLVYVLDHSEAVLEAVRDFISYNTDPKASVMATYETLTTPDVLLNLDEVIVVFLVYDGADPGTAFRNFTQIPRLLDTSKPNTTYTEVADMPIPYTAELSRADNVFRIGAHQIEGEGGRQRPRELYERYAAWADTHKGLYVYVAINFYPVARSMTDASRARGGNAMQMPDGPWFWVNYILATPPGLLPDVYDKIQASFRAMVEATPSAPELPLFLNEAAVDQRPLATFPTYRRLQQIKRQYDPDGFFAYKTGGWTFD
ncbi:hypothetical protein PG999_011511 [Apiospora kogelbergensis]|uniref:FAD-binding PCMH-type domain-containing protein n=1 Tax=Apiospora kogelbergensis TaxID=1337665 RepID=A0AAW0QF13_9PEZI